MKCGWWNRWLHRRQREGDVLFLLPAIAQKADGDEASIDAAFALHASLPGNEHWRCECARQESLLAAHIGAQEEPEK